jgi:hypothetical protein
MFPVSARSILDYPFKNLLLAAAVFALTYNRVA